MALRCSFRHALEYYPLFQRLSAPGEKTGPGVPVPDRLHVSFRTAGISTVNNILIIWHLVSSGSLPFMISEQVRWRSGSSPFSESDRADKALAHIAQPGITCLLDT